MMKMMRTIPIMATNATEIIDQMIEINPLNFQDIKVPYFKIRGIDYQFHGGFGSVLCSYEKHVKVEDLRIICGILFSAYTVRIVNRLTRFQQVNWVPAFPIDAQWIRTFKKTLIESIG